VVRIRFAMVFLGRTTHGRGFRGVDDVIAWLRLEYGPPREPVVPLLRKRDGRVEPFQPAKLAAGVALAAAGRGTAAQVDRLARAVASRVAAELSGQAFLTSQQVAAEALKVLREHDPVAYLRYAAAVKGYQSAADVWLDALALRGGG
jgi:transcriptional regulator NrdR family protein